VRGGGAEVVFWRLSVMGPWRRTYQNRRGRQGEEQVTKKSDTPVEGETPRRLAGGWWSVAVDQRKDFL